MEEPRKTPPPKEAALFSKTQPLMSPTVFFWCGEKGEKR